LVLFSATIPAITLTKIPPRMPKTSDTTAQGDIGGLSGCGW